MCFVSESPTSPLQFSLERAGEADGASAIVASCDPADDGGRGCAERLGVRRGDRLLRVNGVDVRAAGFEGVCDALRSASFPRCLVFSRGANR